jgi:hypothetical protein
MRRSTNNDLVLSTTLAEVFLLLLFVAWYGVSAVSAGPGSLAQLQRDNERLTSELSNANKELVDLRPLKTRVQFLQEILKIVKAEDPKGPVPESIDDWVRWLKTHDEHVAQNAKRGSPMCNAGANVIVVARVFDGAVTVTVLRDISVEIKSAVTYQTGQELSGPAIEQFLASIARFYDERHRHGDDCRYDYRLEWSTDNDYRFGREHFEQPYFYPAGITRVSAGVR